MNLKGLTRLVIIATLLILMQGLAYAEGSTTPIIGDGNGYDISEPSDEIENLVIHMLKNFTSRELNVPEDQIEIIAIEGHGKLFAGRIRVIENAEEHVLKVNLESNNVWFDNKKIGDEKEFSYLDIKSKQILTDHGIEIANIHTSEIEFNGNKFLVVNGEVDGITTSYSINPKGELSKGLSSIKRERAALLRRQSKTDLKLDKYLQQKNKINENDISKSQKIPVYISVNDAEDLKLLNDYLKLHGKVNKVEISKYLPGIATDVDVTDLNELINLDYVSKVYHDAPINIYLDVSAPTVNGNAIPGWFSNDAGSGITVAIIDTGVDDTHPALSGKFAEGNQRDFTGSGTFDDTGGHGTHIAGIIASTDDTYKGIAPGATLVNAKSLDDGASMSLAAAAIDWAVNERGARVIQMSWGEDPIIDGNPNWERGDNNGMHGISRFVDAVAFEEDVVFSNAVSNRHPDPNPLGLVSPPSDAYNVISVGATNDQNTLDVDDDVLALFSAHGPVGSDGTTVIERHKPDVVAPGDNIRSSAHDWEGWGGINQNFVDKRGTSMAAPHVSGAAAVLLANRPSLSSKEVKAILLNTASDITGTRNEIGLGVLDVSEAWLFNEAVLTETATGAGQEIFYKLEPSVLRSFIKATLVWERHASSRQTDTPTSTITPISDLNLFLYKESDNSLIDSSRDIYDNVEQVSSESDCGTCIIKIDPLILNNNLEEFALAYYGTAEKVTPPVFASSFTDFENIPLGSTFTLSLNTANYGDIVAHDVEVNLNLPEGISLVSGSNPVSLGNINSRDEVKTASWVVRAESLGTKSVDASISSTSYGESFIDTVFTSTFDVFENTPPNQPTSFLQWAPIVAEGNVIPFGGITDESTILLDGLVFDPDNTEVQLEVEVRPIGTAFIGIPTCISVPEPSDSWAVASCSDLTSGQYHWQARARDSSDATSPWVSAGGNPETSLDFEVSVSSRTGGPDHFGYTFKDSNTPSGPTSKWIDITTTGTMIMPSSDDVFVSGLPVGFFFNFYGTEYTQVSITNNGIVLASGGTGQYINQPIGSSTPHNFISPFWDDLVTWGSAGAIYYQTLPNPDAPSKKMFVVEWHDNQHYHSSTSGITFEAILYEGTNNIKFQYKDVDFGTVSSSTGSDLPPYNNGGSATVGIEGLDGRGLQYSYNEEVIDPDLAILFKYPQFAGTNMYVSKQAPASKDHGSMMTYTLYYHNFGDTEAQDVVLEDTLPQEVEFISASDIFSYDSTTRKVTWDIGTVAPLGHNYRTVTVRINDNIPVGYFIHNNARIDTSTLEVREDDNDAQAQTRVTGSTLPPDVGVEPNNGGTGTPSVSWNTPITFTYYSECATNIDISIQPSSGSAIAGSMTGGPPDWSYTTSFSTPGEATVTYTITGCSQSMVSFNIYIDPAGYIFDIDTGERIEGATVWLQWSDGEGGWVPVPVIEPAYMIPNINPQISNETGWYQWDVVEGSYRVHVEAAGYYPADSIVVSIPPAVTNLHVGLTRIPSESNQPPVATDDTVTTDEDMPVTFNVTINDSDADGNLDPSSAINLSNPSHGNIVNDGDGTFIYTPAAEYDSTDSFTYEICDTDGLCDTATATINVNPVNDPPVASVDLIEQTVQYSDGISTVTISASDVDSPLTLTTSWKMNDGAEQTGLPDDLTLSSGSCTTTGPSTACTWTLEGKANVTAGNYNITFNMSDGQYEIIKHTNLIVSPEDSSIAFDDGNPVAVKVTAPGGESETFSLKVNIKETIPDLSDALAPFPGDINLAEVSVSLVPVGPGPSVNPASCSRTVAGTGYDATLTLDCGFNDVNVNTYEVMVTVNGGYYIGSGENVLVVYDQSLGFTTGGGTFLWPETGEKTNFGYNMKYNKKGAKVQGSLLLVRHLSDGTIYRVKSNALYGLSIGEDDTYGWASFSGKATYREPEWLEPVGNHEFIVYVEDHDDPGNGADRFWIKVKGQDGEPIDAMSLNYPSIDNTISLSGGNIVVPHK